MKERAGAGREEDKNEEGNNTRKIKEEWEEKNEKKRKGRKQSGEKQRRQ